MLATYSVSQTEESWSLLLAPGCLRNKLARRYL